MAKKLSKSSTNSTTTPVQHAHAEQIIPNRRQQQQEEANLRTKNETAAKLTKNATCNKQKLAATNAHCATVGAADFASEQLHGAVDTIGETHDEKSVGAAAVVHSNALERDLPFIGDHHSQRQHTKKTKAISANATVNSGVGSSSAHADVAAPTTPNKHNSMKRSRTGKQHSADGNAAIVVAGKKKSKIGVGHGNKRIVDHHVQDTTDPTKQPLKLNVQNLDDANAEQIPDVVLAVAAAANLNPRVLAVVTADIMDAYQREQEEAEAEVVADDAAIGLVHAIGDAKMESKIIGYKQQSAVVVDVDHGQQHAHPKQADTGVNNDADINIKSDHHIQHNGDGYAALEEAVVVVGAVAVVQTMR